ncbi:MULTISPECIES: alpha-ketoacid dehydrogenase subunit beta [unclassified Frankia]
MGTEVRETTQLTYFDATLAAIAEKMRHDPSVFFMAQDLRANLYGRFPVDEFGKERIRNLPISEAASVGVGVGAALTGLRPVIDMACSTFLYSAMDQIVNQAAKIRYMSGGQAKVPLLLLVPVFYGNSEAAHHADRPFALFANSPGLKIVAPSTPYDMKGLTTAAIREDDPVLLFRDATLFEMRGPVPDEDYVIPLGLADIKREGTDVTVVAIAGAVRVALAAAQRLETEGISVEVVDPRSLVPLDYETINASVEKTGRVVVVDPAPRTCSFASELVASLAEERFWRLMAAPVRVTAADVPTPFSPPLGGRNEVTNT